MNFPVEQHRVVKRGDLAIEPQMDAAKGPVLMPLKLRG